MKYKTPTRAVEISLRLYEGGWNAGWQPDCFSDLDTTWSDAWDDNEGACVVSDKDLDDIVDWWTAEVNSANSDPEYCGDALVGIPRESRDRGDEWLLLVEDI